LKLIQSCSPDRPEALSERLDRGQVDGVAALRPERVDRDAVPEFLERCGQRCGSASLVVVYGEPVGVGIGG
jgi:hypothetical protein